MDFDSILREMEKERQKAFEIKKKESSKDKEKHEDEPENAQENEDSEDETDRRDDANRDESTSKEDEEERTEDDESEKEESEEVNEEKDEHEETDHVESKEQGESEEKDNEEVEDDEVKEKSSDEDTEKEEHEEPEHDESEEQEEKEESEEVEEDTEKDEEENKDKNEIVKEETETKVETLENVTEKANTLKTPPLSVSPAKLKIKPKLQSTKSNSTKTRPIIKQKDVIKMPKKINVPQKTKIIKTTKIKRVVTKPAASAKKITQIKPTAFGAPASGEIKKLAKDVARLKEGLDKLLKQQKENYTISLRKQKEKEIETIRKNKEKEIEAIKRDKEKEASALKIHAELKNELNKSAKKEDLSKESKIIANEVDKVRKDIAYLKEFQPEILFNSIQKLNENITEMNSLFRLAAELMQKPDPVQSKLKKLFDENEKIAQGILTVLDAVNEIKQFGTREVEDIRRIEDEIRLPLKEIALRKQTDDMEAPSIPAPPPEFRETSANEDSFTFGSSDISGISRETTDKNKASFEAEDADLPLPPEMTPIPTSTGAPIPPESFQSFGQQAQSSAMRPAQPSQFGSARGLPTGKSSGGAFPNELPPSPTEFTPEQLDQLASMVPPLPRPTNVQLPQQRMQQQPQTQFQARQQSSQQRPARFVRKKEELKM